MVEEAQVERNALDRGKADDTPSVNGLLRTAIGWGIVWGVGWSVCLGAIFTWGGMLYDESIAASDVQWVIASSIASATVVTGSLLPTSRALRRTEPFIKRMQALPVAISWAISLTIGLAGGGTIGGLWLFALPIWIVVAWAIAVAIAGGALMFWQLGRVRPAPKALLPRGPVDRRATRWIHSRMAVLLLLLIGFSGPWTSCSPCFMCLEEPYNLPKLLWVHHIFAAQYVAPVLLLFIVTLLFLVWRNLRNSDVVIWLERFAVVGSLLDFGLARLYDDKWFWGFRATAAGVLLALLNLIGELITTRERRL